MDSTLILPARKLAPAALPAGLACFFGLGSYAMWMAVHTHNPQFLMGLLPALEYLGACVVFGVRILPRWAKLTSGLFLLAGATVFTFCGLAITYSWFTPQFFPADFMFGPAIGMAACGFFALLFAGGGWVYQDAQARGLNAAMWAVFTIVLSPYLVGFILYLVGVVIRDQRRAPCGNCGAQLAPTMAYCTACGTQARTVCAGCGARSQAGATYCGSCGRALASTVAGA